MIYFGIKLKSIRENAKMTQEQLGDILNVQKATISAYERGSAYPSVEGLAKLCAYFKVSADYMLGLSDMINVKTMDLTEEQTTLIFQLINQFHELNNKIPSILEPADDLEE